MIRIGMRRPVRILSLVRPDRRNALSPAPDAAGRNR